MMNNVVEKKSSATLVKSNQIITSLRAFAETIKIEFNEDNARIVSNSLRQIQPLIEKEGLTWNDVDQDNLMFVLQQATFLKVDPSANPRECGFIIRNINNKKKLEFFVEGAGNDAILRNFGVGVKEVRSYVVYEGDEFTLPYMDGWDYVLPKHIRKFQSNKVLYAVYLVKKHNDEIEVLMADRETVKQSLLAQMRQNGVEEKVLRKYADWKLDDLLTKEETLDMKIDKEYYDKYKKQTVKYQTSAIGINYGSVVSRESMIDRKMRNHATRRYPKNFNSTTLMHLYEETFEDEKYRTDSSLVEHKTQTLIGETEKQFNEETSSEEINVVGVGEEINVIEVDENTGEIVEENTQSQEKKEKKETPPATIFDEPIEEQKEQEQEQDSQEWWNV